MNGNSSEKRFPPVEWAERKTLIYLFIHVTDCKKPEIKLEKDKLHFRGINEEAEYEVMLNLFKDVDVETSKYSVRDRGIDFILKKVEAGPYWNKLLKDNKKYHWLRVDFTRWKDEDDSENEECDESEFEDMMKKMSGLSSTNNDLNDLDSDEEEEKD